MPELMRPDLNDLGSGGAGLGQTGAVLEVTHLQIVFCFSATRMHAAKCIYAQLLPATSNRRQASR